jgi:hypothetical protein
MYPAGRIRYDLRSALRARSGGRAVVLVMEIDGGDSVSVRGLRSDRIWRAARGSGRVCESQFNGGTIYRAGTTTFGAR